MEKVLFLLQVLLLTVTSSTQKEFQCAPGALGCQFKPVRKNASDEEIFGLCDFELDTCGWKDVSESESFTWKREMANITTVPGLDHTTGDPFGHVMYTSGRGYTNTANLEYSIDKLAALGCQMSFWYHIGDDKALWTLKVILLRDKKQYLLLNLNEKKKDGWENAKVFIGNRPAGYKLDLSFDPPMSTMDVMLDDMKFEYCAEGDVPEDSDQLSCDFEENTCSWYHDYTASMLWEKGIGSSYMQISTSSSTNSSSTARLMSFPRPVGRVICVSFWYRIFGNSIGSLKFLTKPSGGEETLVWLRSGTQGNRWRFADLSFKNDQPIQFIIEAVLGGNQGSIAIDDIMVYRSESDSCPAEKECTFQSSLCGLLPEPSTTETWARMTGMSKPASSSGPTVDHTLGTDQGYYLSAQLWKHLAGTRVAIMTPVMESTVSEGDCLMFWYHMEGSGVGELSVYLQGVDESRQPVSWNRGLNQGNHWRHGRVTLSSRVPFQVIFEAVVGDETGRDIAIDDYIVVEGSCPPQGLCDFEMDFCGWVNDPPPEDGVEWEWLSGESHFESVEEFIPSKDHTTNSKFGHFAYFRPLISDKRGTAQLQSEMMAAVDHACLEMWHYAQGWGTGNSSGIIQVFVKDSGGQRLVGETRSYTNSSWILDRMDYSASAPHQIIIKAWDPNLKKEILALDDIHIIRDRFCNATASDMDCTFEHGLCSWVQEVIDDLGWTLSHGLDVEQPWDGPQYDHTVGNNEGFFLLLNGSGSKNGDTASISVPAETLSATLCVGFWYQMSGPSVPSLNLLVKTKSSEDLIWTRQGTQNPEWINAQVTINLNGMQKLTFTGNRTTSSQGFIAIDDITVREGVCKNELMCSFDSNMCDFTNNEGHHGKWVHMKATKDEVDHSSGTENGFYLTTTSAEAVQLLSRLFKSTTKPENEHCARFWYWLPKGPSNVLTVHVMENEELGDALWRTPGVPSAGWEVAEVTVSSRGGKNGLYVVFQAVHGSSSASKIKLDDISVRDGPCSPPASCDFGSGLCSWVNLPTVGGHDWVVASSVFQGSLIDHTTQTAEGQFLLSSTLEPDNSLAQISSEWIQLNDMSCLSLWYQMDSSTSGLLKVLKHTGPEEEELLFSTNSSEPNWTKFSKDVQMDKPFQLRIVAETKNRGFVAVDDITITPGRCQVNETGLGFVGCSFENDTCGWEEIGVGHCRWARGSNSSDYGPSIDNTLGTEQGWYIAVIPNGGLQMSPTTLQSPTMKQASSICTLRFYYIMYGWDQMYLDVVLRVGARTTTLLRLSEHAASSWVLCEVTVGRVPQDFNILFEASREFDHGEYLAIDDIDFSNCSLPESQPLCPENMFQCNNSVCVEPSRICDFTDDCGDRSDEMDCDAKGYVERCTFERGLCSWARSDEDSPEAEWSRHRGEEAWPQLGPMRDHTQNTAAGHYVIPGKHKTVSGQTSEILSRTLLPSSNCTVRFFFWSLEDTATKLTVQSRTFQAELYDSVLWLKNNLNSYNWQRAEVTFSTSVNSKLVLRATYKPGFSDFGLFALDDISFSRECAFDPDNSPLPSEPSTPAPPTTPTASPCLDDEFQCWQSPDKPCIKEYLLCDYHPDCQQGEDEEGCGECTFERDQCSWRDDSGLWLRHKASNDTDPPTDHTTQTGHYMRVNFTKGSPVREAFLQSPSLSPTTPYCQIQFHFHINRADTGSLRLLMQQDEADVETLWSYSHNTVSHWRSVKLPIGQHKQPYTVQFSSTNQPINLTAEDTQDHIAAVDDISFLGCERIYTPPPLPACGCSFEDGLCLWVQEPQPRVEWLSWSGATDNPHTGPEGDHTSGTGKYLYIDSSSPSLVNDKAQLKSPMLPPAGEYGYCLTFWRHMFGANVGFLRIILQTAGPWITKMVWQRQGNQGDEWQKVQFHVTLQHVHQVILEATVGGEVGDIAIDDISFSSGPCPVSDMCDFEDGSCNWQQHTDDDWDWVRESGPSPSHDTGPNSDHTTNSPYGHYFSLQSSLTDFDGQTAKVSSPLYPAGKGSCLQLWYHMYGRGVGMLRVYQQGEDGKQTLIFSQAGDQGRLWRFGQASLLPPVQPYRIIIEGVKAGPSEEGDMALDDVLLSDAACSFSEDCDFEINMCTWSNVGSDEHDWFRRRGNSRGPLGPSVDHTTHTPYGHYLHVDTSMGHRDHSSILVSDVLQPSITGHCLTFWYNMHGSDVGTLKVGINNRNTQPVQTEKPGILIWSQSGDKGDEWRSVSLHTTRSESFWFVFEYETGWETGAVIALDDLSISRGSCFSPLVDPPVDDDYGNLKLHSAVSILLFLIQEIRTGQFGKFCLVNRFL
ncbi:MAM and LDL-receptor class A domain-containing protein 1 [Nelusetta ayraudi]|uniref:MAM and LDL-receptor class A domain-containing protein 1 n=1 Tax=Nelusetta ayraudi TaxID=303726 RepID=UPI003F708644